MLDYILKNMMMMMMMIAGIRIGIMAHGVRGKAGDAYYYGLKIGKEDEKRIGELIGVGMEEIGRRYEFGEKEEDGWDLLQWTTVKDFHVTTLFEANKDRKCSLHYAYEFFNEGQKEMIQIIGMVYVPKKIITLIVKADTPIQNQIPHITVLLKDYSPKHSNDVLESIFLNDKPLHYLYTQRLTTIPKSTILIKLSNMILFTKTHTIYTLFFNHNHSFLTTMTSYSNSSSISMTYYNPITYILTNNQYDLDHITQAYNTLGDNTN